MLVSQWGWAQRGLNPELSLLWVSEILVEGWECTAGAAAHPVPVCAELPGAAEECEINSSVCVSQVSLIAGLEQGLGLGWES